MPSRIFVSQDEPQGECAIVVPATEFESVTRVIDGMNSMAAVQLLVRPGSCGGMHQASLVVGPTAE